MKSQIAIAAQIKKKEKIKEKNTKLSRRHSGVDFSLQVESHLTREQRLVIGGGDNT